MLDTIMPDIRSQFETEFDRCWLCGVKAINTWPPRLETHEISRGPNRQKSLQERCALIRTCQRCHQNRLDGMDVVQQYALKLMFDPNGYDRVRLNRLRNRADNAVTEGEVRVALCELQEMAEASDHPFPRWIVS